MKKIGLRTIKTGIAVFLATLAGYLGVVETPVYTISVCIFSIKNTIRDSYKDALSRILGTLLGGFIGFIFICFLGEGVASTTLGVILVIHLCNLLKISDSAAIASVTFTSITLGVGKNYPLTYSLMRTLDTLVGVLIALIVNYSVSRSKYLKYLRSSFNSTFDNCINLSQNMMNYNDYSSYSKLQEKFYELKEYYNQLITELHYPDETNPLTKLYANYDACEQLLHHIHGLYLRDKRIDVISSNKNSSIYKYHKNKVKEILEEYNKFNIP